MGWHGVPMYVVQCCTYKYVYEESTPSSHPFVYLSIDPSISIFVYHSWEIFTRMEVDFVSRATAATSCELYHGSARTVAAASEKAISGG
jgi:hypothetical protein